MAYRLARARGESNKENNPLDRSSLSSRASSIYYEYALGKEGASKRGPVKRDALVQRLIKPFRNSTNSNESAGGRSEKGRMMKTPQVSFKIPEATPKADQVKQERQSFASIDSMDQVLTFPKSLGITPARRKALAHLSQLNYKTLENKMAAQNAATAQETPDALEEQSEKPLVSRDSKTSDGDTLDTSEMDNFLEAADGWDTGENYTDVDEGNQTCFGQLLADFGYKKVFKASGKELCAHVPIWHLQRPTDPGRVKELVRSKRGKLDFQGAISIFDFEAFKGPSLECPQKTGVFDGQHRILAINELLKEQDGDIPVLVEVYPVVSQDDVKRLFLDINKAEMVQEIDLPNHLATSDKVIIDEACNLLQGRYPEMFKGERCRAPHCHLATLRNELFLQRNAVLALNSANPITTAAQLLDMIEACNSTYAAKPKSYWPKGVHRNLPKAERNHFFLGLEKDWVGTELVRLVEARGTAL